MVIAAGGSPPLQPGQWGGLPGPVADARADPYRPGLAAGRFWGEINLQDCSFGPGSSLLPA